MTTATKYIARQTAQRLILTVCGDLAKRLEYAKIQGDAAINLSLDDADDMERVLRKARESLIGV